MMKADFSELWRRHTVAYAPIRRLVGTSVYPQHVSGVIGAVFPALSLYVLASPMKMGMVYGQYQMDSWSKSEEEARHLQDYLEDLWTPENIDELPADTDLGVQVLFIRQANRFDGAYEPDTKLYHKVGIYNIAWRPK